MLAVAVLGPLEVSVDGAPVEVPRGKASELLARLALEAGQLVSADRLVEDLWESATSEVRRNTREQSHQLEDDDLERPRVQHRLREG